MTRAMVLAVAAVLVLVAPAWAYEEITVSDGGTISGTVTITGGKPIAKGFNLITIPDLHQIIENPSLRHGGAGKIGGYPADPRGAIAVRDAMLHGT